MILLLNENSLLVPHLAPGMTPLEGHLYQGELIVRGLCRRKGKRKRVWTLLDVLETLLDLCSHSSILQAEGRACLDTVPI